MRKYKCGRYLRLSKEDELKKDESSSIASQRMIIESFAKFQGLEVIKEYIDDGFSGGNFDRPGFKEMIKDIENGVINCVITKDLSRLGRELYQTGRYIEEYFIDNNIRYIAINDGYDSLLGDNMLSMRLTFNDFTLRDVSKKVKSSLTAKQKNGEYIGTYPKYGYLKDPANHHKLIIDPVASLVVKRMFEMARQGNSCYKIASVLTEEKVPIPIVYKKESRGALITDNDGFGIWRPQTIRDILTSEMYIGNMVQNTYNKVRYNSKRIRATKKEEYIIVEGTHEPIIDKETFELVGKLISSKSLQKQREQKEKYLFTGLLKCKECSHNISILKKKCKKSNSHYTQCNGYSKKGKYGVCKIHRVNYNLLEEDLIKIINEICDSYLKEYNNKKLTYDANKLLESEITKIQKQIDILTKEISKYDTLIEQIYIDKVGNKIPEKTFDSLLNNYNEKLEVSSAKKKELLEQKEKFVMAIKKFDFESCKTAVRSFLKTKKPSRELIVNLVEKVEIDNDNNIKLYFKFPELTSYLR